MGIVAAGFFSFFFIYVPVCLTQNFIIEVEMSLSFPRVCDQSEEVIFQLLTCLLYLSTHFNS